MRGSNKYIANNCFMFLKLIFVDVSFVLAHSVRGKSFSRKLAPTSPKVIKLVTQTDVFIHR